MYKKAFSILTALLMVFSFSTTAFAYSGNTVKTNESSEQSIHISDYTTDEDVEFMKDLRKVLPQFTLDENNKLVLDISDNELLEKYGYTEAEVEKIHGLILISITQ